jgi:signal transduction histidine kinase
MCVISHQSEIGYGAANLDETALRGLLWRIHQAARTTMELIEAEIQGLIGPERFDLRLIVERVTEMARSHGECSARVNCIVPPDHVWMIGHPEAVLRVCLNLALNAVDASAGGEVTLSVSTQSEPPDADALVAGVVPKAPWVMLAVVDDAPGIPPELSDRIWGRGFTTKGTNGSGEGLALVRRLVEEAGAGVTVAPGLGIGTRFCVYWPEQLTAADPVKGADHTHSAWPAQD